VIWCNIDGYLASPRVGGEEVVFVFDDVHFCRRIEVRMFLDLLGGYLGVILL
jgi:hypothetical protein